MQNEALFGHLRPFYGHLRAEKGKKLGIFARLEAKWKGDNEENPLRGIETSAYTPTPTPTDSDNEENPLRGIETCRRPTR
jgi:hypothetical protein